MPLNVHPSSTCDICMDPFAVPGHDDDASKTPHTISCGHIFCRSCLLNVQLGDGMDYPACPHCRKPYRRDKIKPLFVGADPERDKPTPEGLVVAVRRMDAAVSTIRRNEEGYLPPDLGEAVEHVHGFVQMHPALDVPVERLVDAFAAALDKFSEKSRELSDYKYRDRRHAVDDEKLALRHNVCHEIYIDKIMELREALSKYTGARVHLPEPQVVMPDSRKQRRNTSTVLGPPAVSSLPSPSQIPSARVREEIRRSVETLADFRCQPADVDLAPRGHAIEQGNALGLGEDIEHERGSREHTRDPVRETRRLAQGRTTEWVGSRQLETPLDADRRLEPRRDEESRPRPPERSVSEAEARRHARRASTGERLMSAPEVQRLVHIPDLAWSGRGERHDHRDAYTAAESGERHRLERGHEVLVQRERYEVAPPITRTHDSAMRIQHDSSREQVPAPRAEPLALAASAPAHRPSRPRASTMTRSVSLQPPRPLDSEYATPRVSEPPTPYPSATHTPHSAGAHSLHSSPNPPPHLTVPAPGHAPAPAPYSHPYTPPSAPSAQPMQYSAHPQARPAPIPSGWYPSAPPAAPSYIPPSWPATVPPVYASNVAPQRTNTLY